MLIQDVSCHFNSSHINPYPAILTKYHMHYDEKAKDYKQVRTRKGGGTRIVRLDKKCTKSDIISECKNLFFPDKKYSMGCEDEMLIDLNIWTVTLRWAR